MAERQKGRKALVVAAEAAGRTIGRVARAVDLLEARHPHPVAEVQEAVAVGMKKLAAATVATTKAADQKAAVQRAQQVAAHDRRKAKAETKRVKQAGRRPTKVLPAKRATSVQRKASAAPGTSVRTLQSAHVKRRQAHAASRTRRRQARRDRKR
jgi:hypothetical protein